MRELRQTFHQEGTGDQPPSSPASLLFLFSHSVVSDSLQPCGLQHARLLYHFSFTISRSLQKLMSFESVMPPKHLILCRRLLFWTSVFPSIRVFSNELALRIRWLEYWSFSISPSSEYSGLISFKINWFDLLAVHVNTSCFLAGTD